MAGTETPIESLGEALNAIENLIQFIDVEDHDTSHVILRVRDAVVFTRMARAAIRFLKRTRKE